MQVHYAIPQKKELYKKSQSELEACGVVFFETDLNWCITVLQLSQVRSEPGWLALLLTSDREVQSTHSYIFMDAFFILQAKAFILY